MRDPSREELIEYLERSYPRVTCGETVHPEGIAGLLLDAMRTQGEPSCPDGCGCRFDIEEAAYWAAVHCHGGQSSSLYGAVCQSPYDPGRTSDLPDDEGRPIASELYREAVEWVTGKPFEEVSA